MHNPVLLKEVLEYLKPKEGEIIVDGTFGGGGHAREILKAVGKKGKVIGLDQDKEALKEKKKQANLVLINENFRKLDKVLDSLKIKYVNGVLFDLGFSTTQLEEAGRGLSFQKDEPLLMTLNPSQKTNTAKEILNEWDEKDIADLIYKYGEERFSRRIARRIVERREEEPIETTFQLVDVIRSAVPATYRHGRINCATRTFQALRIAVNDELGALEEGLIKAWDKLDKKGRLAVISFHSLEDRMVKRFFISKKEEAKILTKKPIIASEEEAKINPKSRSAKLRVIEKN